MFELDDAQDPVVDRRHPLRHWAALAVVECATAGQAAQTGWGISHRLDCRLRQLRRIGLRNHHPRDAEVEVLEDDLTIVFADAHERRHVSGLRRQDHRVGVIGADAAMLGVEECKIESSQRYDFDHIRGGDRDEYADRGASGAQRLFDRIIQSHCSPHTRVPRCFLVDLRSISATLILSKRRQSWIKMGGTRNCLALQSIHASASRAEKGKVTITDRQHAIGSLESDSETPYWLAISRVPYIGPARIERLLQTFGSLSVAWSAPREELRLALEPRSLSELLAARSRIDPVSELERLARSGIRAVHPGHPSYPRLLAEISGRPSVLFVRGELAPADARSVAIVG